MERSETQVKYRTLTSVRPCNPLSTNDSYSLSTSVSYLCSPVQGKIGSIISALGSPTESTESKISNLHASCIHGFPNWKTCIYTSLQVINHDYQIAGLFTSPQVPSNMNQDLRFFHYGVIHVHTRPWCSRHRSFNNNHNNHISPIDPL